jgi:hypothetical protein
MDLKKGSVKLKNGYHEFKLEYFEYMWGEGLILMYDGPGIKRQIIPGEVFRINQRRYKELQRQVLEAAPDFDLKIESVDISSNNLNEDELTHFIIGFKNYGKKDFPADEMLSVTLYENDIVIATAYYFSNVIPKRKESYISTKNEPGFGWFAESGVHEIAAVVDAQDVYKETDEKNNVFIKKVHIKPRLPDLVITVAELQKSKEDPSVFIFSSTLSNSGSSLPSGLECTVKVKINKISIAVDTVNFYSLDYSESKKIQFEIAGEKIADVFGGVIPSEYEMFVYLDAGDDVDEINKNNNYFKRLVKE